MNIRMSNQLFGKIGVVLGTVMLALFICGFFGLAPNPVRHVAYTITVAFCLTLRWCLMCDDSCPATGADAGSGADPA